MDHTTIRLGFTPLGLKDIKQVLTIELPNANDNVRRGEPIGFVEAEKIVLDLFAPVDGRVLDVNLEVLKNPNLLLTDGTWLVEMIVYQMEQWNHLLSQEQYLMWVKGES